MELWTILKEAELDLFFMSGSGLGAVLLALIALVAILRSRKGDSLVGLLKHFSGLRKRND